MPETHDHYVNARNLAVDILRKETARTPELIQHTAEKAAHGMRVFDSEANIDVEKLTAELRHLFSVGVERATALDDDEPHAHEPWLPTKRAGISWRFWNRYMTYLEREFGMAPTVVNNLHELTDMILERIEDSARPAPWDRRGMVVGSVQSGKTANYIGLICKAIDAGYKLVIILAGIHSNLRAQTQLRVDEGVLGFDTQKSRKLNNDNRWVGVGKLPGERLVVHSLTSSADNGDFNKTVAENIGVMLGGDPVVLVIKKNSKLLANLSKWVLHVAGTDDLGTGKRVVKNVPLLLIDDEADNASINTKTGTDEDSVSAINGKIRELLESFEKDAYVGYTATPFANIFINPDAETDKHGEDLFPRSFIINVKPPTNYVGPVKVFGLDGDPDAGISAHAGLPIIREIDDFGTAFPPGHKKDHVPQELSKSLKQAVRCFILVCAARRARGQEKKHNSMLVHVTRFVDVQNLVVKLVRDELVALQRRIEFGDGNKSPSIYDELGELWETEFVPVTKALADDNDRAVSWKKIEEALHYAASKIVVLPINGFAKEALDYKEHEEEGRSVIAVGGDKLSRGLTLEGLSISYFLRTSRMYDTLMQMGRWFGYRPGYLDLCRLFTTGTLVTWYRYIALAETELRREFDYMVAAGLTPEKYGLRVRTHPGGMIVTALNKMSHSQKHELSWAGVLVQTTQLPKDETRRIHNLSITAELLSRLSRKSGPRTIGKHETRLWRDVPGTEIADFVESLEFPTGSARASGEQLAAFIRQQNQRTAKELSCWTIALVSVADGASKDIGDFEVGLVERTPEAQTNVSFTVRKANILNPADEAWDLKNQVFDEAWFDAISNKPELLEEVEWLHNEIGGDAWDVALELTRKWQKTDPPKIKPPLKNETTRPNGRIVRLLRKRTNGLLLIYPIVPPNTVKDEVTEKFENTGLDKNSTPIIGIALSFPTSDTAEGVEYRVNKVWQAEMQDDAAYDD